jgi:nicotinamide mononucleotide (NMN) deamidase PncC
MKKLLTVLVALLVVVSMFAAEKPFTLGPNVTYTGKVTFTLGVDANGIDISGALSVDSASLAFGPTSDTQAGATFGISYTPFGGVSLTLKSITFSTPYFGAFYSTGKLFVSDYFTGKDYDNDTWASAMADFADSLKLTFPAVPGLEVYYLDKTSEGAATWFSDMLLVKYPVSGFTIVGGTYNTGNTTTHEFGAEVKGALDLGVFKPNLTVFGGMVDGGSSMVTAYDFILSGSLSPVTGLTLAPTFKFAENLDKLDYKSTNVVNGKYISLGVTYTTTFTPVTLTAKVTPKVDFSAATPTTTLKLNELSAKVEVAPVTLFVKTTNDNLLDSSKKYTLYTEASYSDPMLSGSVKAEWADITQFATYTYIHGAVTIKATPELTLYSDVHKIIASTNDFGYNVRAAYAITPNVKLTGFYGTLTTDSNGAYTVINADPTWNVKLTYSASF